ncbi:MAG: GSCFA domain-containing protein [Bacteroidales bacterium]|nr:GSCFA domain-containing protein [Bacteroidales bacterium]
MVRLFTEVQPQPSPVRLRLGSRILVLGSCFADAVGRKMEAAGFDVCVNPFGTLYNPCSVRSALQRLDGGTPFTDADCVGMGAGSPLVCSFSHHTSFARPTREEFLGNANESLARASAFWKDCDTVIVSLGTSMVWKRAGDGSVVSNCLKRPAAEFKREMLDLETISGILCDCIGLGAPRRFIFTVSPIRHLSDGAHVNAVSKARLLLAVDSLAGAEYFPAYEIMLDELRDYRFYAEDLCHPSPVAENIIWERFLGSFVREEDLGRIHENEKAARRAAHRPLH